MTVVKMSDASRDVLRTGTALAGCGGALGLAGIAQGKCARALLPVRQSFLQLLQEGVEFRLCKRPELRLHRGEGDLLIGDGALIATNTALRLGATELEECEHKRAILLVRHFIFVLIRRSPALPVLLEHVWLEQQIEIQVRAYRQGGGYTTIILKYEKALSDHCAQYLGGLKDVGLCRYIWGRWVVVGWW